MSLERPIRLGITEELPPNSFSCARQGISARAGCRHPGFMVEMAELIFKQAKLEYEIVAVNTNRDYGSRAENGECLGSNVFGCVLTRNMYCSVTCHARQVS